jgi:predicted dinucleotide-binding enzyme
MTTHSSTTVRTVGIIGAGKSGTAIARVAIRAGYDVRIATSGPADRTRLITSILTPEATAVNSSALMDTSDLVVLAVPLRHYSALPLHRLAGRIAIDVMNYWRPVDGILPDFQAADRTSSEIVRDSLPTTAHLVKTLNHIGYHEIEELARPTGTPDRTALGVAGDNPSAVDDVAAFIDNIGFTPIILGELAAGAILQPGSPLFGANLNERQLRRELAAADVTPPRTKQPIA